MSARVRGLKSDSAVLPDVIGDKSVQSIEGKDSDDEQVVAREMARVVGYPLPVSLANSCRV